jgi:hypothetical protein
MSETLIRVYSPVVMYRDMSWEEPEVPTTPEYY